jgi:peptidoglycan-associated lipoprotein
MKLFKSSLIAAAAVALISGCASSVKLDDVPVETRAATPAGAASSTGADTGAASQSQVTTVDLSKQADAMLAGTAKVIYFDYDSYVVRGEYKPTIEANAKALTTDRKRHLVVEGHTDERGGREYNLALGQKRAEAVVKSLELLGATEAQLEAVSFGKERPAVQGSDEAAWAKNRRAELVYR